MLLQEAIAQSFEVELGRLDGPECYLHHLPVELEPKRDQLAQMLQDAEMFPVIPEGGYFMLADISAFGTLLIICIFFKLIS